MIEKSLSELNFATLTNRDFFPSPAAWEDQVLYFLMLDRFSDGKEQGYRDNDGNIVASVMTPMFKNEDRGNVTRTVEERSRWFEAGGKFAGCTLKGLASKMGYLKRLSVTTIWVSLIFKQVAFQETYHGYGIQNSLDVDPHFGTREDLREVGSSFQRRPAIQLPSAVRRSVVLRFLLLVKMVCPLKVVFYN